MFSGIGAEIQFISNKSVQSLIQVITTWEATLGKPLNHRAFFG